MLILADGTVAAVVCCCRSCCCCPLLLPLHSGVDRHCLQQAAHSQGREGREGGLHSSAAAAVTAVVADVFWEGGREL